MNAFVVAAAAALWTAALIGDVWLGSLWAVVFGIWLLFRFGSWKPALLWALVFCLFLFSLDGQKMAVEQACQSGEYVVLSLSANTAVAKEADGNRKIVLRLDEEETAETTSSDMEISGVGDQSLAPGDHVQVLETEPIHSQSNVGLFSYQTMMAKKGVLYQATGWRWLQSSHSLPARFWRFLESRSDGGVWKFFLYGIRPGNTEEETEEDETEMAQSGLDLSEWISMLGLGLTGALLVMERWLKRFLDVKKAGMVLLGVGGAVGYLVGFPLSLSRFLLFRAVRLAISSRPWQWSLCIVLFLLLFPLQGDSLCFVLPSILSFCSMYWQGWKKKAGSLLVCAWLQMLWFGSVNVWVLAGYGLLRKGLGWAFWLCLLLAWNPELLARLFWNVYGMKISAGFGSIAGMAPLWYGILLAGVLLVLLWRRDRNGLWLAGVGLFCLYPFVWKLDPFFHVYMLDVGQGDCTVLVEPFGQSAVMIDAPAGSYGSRDLSEELLIPFLQSRQISHLDALIVTHEDADHSGSAQSLCEKFPVRQVVSDCAAPLDNVFYSFSIWQMEEEVPAQEAEPEEGQDSEEGLEQDPEQNLEQKQTENAELDNNDRSLVCRFGYDGWTYLWMGDASVDVETVLMEQWDVQSDVLKLGHHGSSTSSKKEFLQEVQPALALISSGYHNRYHHPSLEVLVRLKQCGINELNTADHGMIHLQTLKDFCFVECADGLVSALVRPDWKNLEKLENSEELENLEEPGNLENPEALEERQVLDHPAD